MTLGLRYPTVRLAESTPAWADAFAVEHEILAGPLTELGCHIEHIGSTAVPGLVAKPILDIAIGLPEGIAIEVVKPLLEQVGYEYGGDAKDAGGHVFVRARDDVRTHHAHVVPLGGIQWRRYLSLRDLLREDEHARSEYARVKIELAGSFPNDRRAYMDGKDEIVTRLLERRDRE